MTFADDVRDAINLCAKLEAASLPERVATRLTNAFCAAFEKRCVLAWYDHIEDTDRVNRTVVRHLYRGAYAHIE